MIRPGSGSVPLTNGSLRPKNMRIRIHNTGLMKSFSATDEAIPLLCSGEAGNSAPRPQVQEHPRQAGPLLRHCRPRPLCQVRYHSTYRKSSSSETSPAPLQTSASVSSSVADPGCLSRIPDPDPGSWFLPIPDPGSRIPDPGSRIQ